ncbi:hypothetical protein NFI95_05800 [Acetobacteraceae bacterium KSS8]|uniref:DUF551 domain-containing protein n=1 Tax=Endosaccharibacter trunci TaxID=2812733 RepID=A0ABT1W5E4_9PROT|nr:hypothetical protein [Acetobacteraceae bacterium KSS8]
MAEFKRGDTVRRVKGNNDFFPVGATALVIGVRAHGCAVRVSVNGEYGRRRDGEDWWIDAADLELVTPAPVAQPARKIVQISSAMSSGEGGIIVYIALCDDGTLWESSSVTGWQQLPPIPQPEPTP